MSLFKKKNKKAARPATPKVEAASVVIVAAGSSSRMGGEDKILAALGGSPVIAHTAAAFEASPYIDEIILVTREESIPLLARLCKEQGFRKVKCVVRGGETRAESVMCGLAQLRPEAGLVAVQDGARPLVTPALIEALVVKAARTGAAIPAVPVRDTVKRVKAGSVEETPERASLYAAQTPQVFDPELLKAALTKARDEGWEITDDASAVERLGMKVTVVPGEEDNLKITTPRDLVLAGLILEGRQSP